MCAVCTYGLMCTFAPWFILFLFFLHRLPGITPLPKVFGGAPLAAGWSSSFSTQQARSFITACHVPQRSVLAWQAANPCGAAPLSSFFSGSCSLSKCSLCPFTCKIWKCKVVGGYSFSPLIISLFHWISESPLISKKNTLFILELCSRQYHNCKNFLNVKKSKDF